MVINEYTHLSPLKLCELIRHLTRSEQDVGERLAAREKQVREAGADKPDPVRKRLFFLLLKLGRQRRAVEKALATRDNAQPLFLEGYATTTSNSMSVAAAATACRTADAHPDSAENLRKEDPASYSTSPTRCIFESGEAAAAHVPAKVPCRTGESRIHVRGVPARLRAVCTRLQVALAWPRVALPATRSTS